MQGVYLHRLFSDGVALKRSRKLRTLIAVAILGFVASCTQQQSSESVPEDVEEISIDPTDIPEKADISEWIKEVRLIPLQESDGLYIGQANELVLHNGHYVVLDRHVSKQAAVFDTLGNPVASFGKIGRGPGELVQLVDMWLTNANNIELYDNYLTRILTYGQDYQLIGERSFENRAMFQAVETIPGADGYIGFAGRSVYNQPYDGQSYRLAFLNDSLEITGTELQYDPKLNGALIMTPDNPFAKVNDTLLFFEHYTNAIFQVKPNGQLAERYRLSYGADALPADFETRLIEPNLALFTAQEMNMSKMRDVFKGYAGFQGRWLESAGYALFDSFDEGQNHFTTLYGKDRKEVLGQGRMLVESDRYHIILPSFMATQVTGNRFIALFDGLRLQHAISKDSPLYPLIDDHPEKDFILEVVFN